MGWPRHSLGPNFTARTAAITSATIHQYVSTNPTSSSMPTNCHKGLAGFYPNPFGRAAFIVGLANDVAIATGAVVEVVVCPIFIRPTATGAATS